MKVYFVGMHNKPDCLPLDSKTKSGKLIDEIISEISAECIKTNMCNTEYLPTDTVQAYFESSMWFERYNPKANDVIVLLGKWVQKYFVNVLPNCVHLRHPASLYKIVDKEIYVNDAVKQINKFL